MNAVILMQANNFCNFRVRNIIRVTMYVCLAEPLQGVERYEETIIPDFEPSSTNSIGVVDALPKRCWTAIGCAAQWRDNAGTS